MEIYCTGSGFWSKDWLGIQLETFSVNTQIWRRTVTYRRMFLLSAIMGTFLLAASSPAMAEVNSFPVITGEHWVNASPEERLAFIAGMTTMIELEKEIQGASLPKDHKSLIPAWVSGLSRFQLKDIVAALDDVFKKKPEMKQKPVVEVLWYEVAFPKTNNK